MSWLPLAPVSARAARRIVLVGLLMPVAGGLVVAQGPADPYATAMHEGNVALSQRRYDEAIKAYKRANGLKGKKSADAYLGIGQASYSKADYKGAESACKSALKYAGDDGTLTARIRLVHGLALIALDVQADQTKRFDDAEADLRAATQSPEVPEAWYHLGRFLLWEKRDDEGLQALRRFIDIGGPTNLMDEARLTIAKPDRARYTFSPDFDIKTTDGVRRSLSTLRGQVVLLDFWGSWCGPCRASTPDLVGFYRKHANDPLVMISVDFGDTDIKWRHYLDQNDMEWPQYQR